MIYEPKAQTLRQPLLVFLPTGPELVMTTALAVAAGAAGRQVASVVRVEITASLGPKALLVVGPNSTPPLDVGSMPGMANIDLTAWAPIPRHIGVRGARLAVWSWGNTHVRDTIASAP